MDLVVKKREKLGKAVRGLRREGLIPAELYGHGVENLHLAVPAKEFAKLFREAGGHTIVNLNVGGEKRPALVGGVQRDYLTGEVSHVDFYQVRLDEKIRAKIPLEFSGEAPAVKKKEGVLHRVVSELEVEALPQDLPHKLVVDLRTLDDLNKSFYVKDLKFPVSVKVLVEPETVVATVVPPRKEEEKVAAPAEAEVSTVKVETEEKKAERAKGVEAQKEKVS